VLDAGASDADVAQRVVRMMLFEHMFDINAEYMYNNSVED